MSYLGFPIIGDFKYGDRGRASAAGSPLRLHAFSLSFPDVLDLPDPVRGLTVTAPMPRVFSIFKEGLI
jgi:23S rRNA-/tRNA-specific pseudouridylate synthase